MPPAPVIFGSTRRTLARRGALQLLDIEVGAPIQGALLRASRRQAWNILAPARLKRGPPSSNNFATKWRLPQLSKMDSLLASLDFACASRTSRRAESSALVISMIVESETLRSAGRCAR